MDDILAEFIEETGEHLATIERLLPAFRKDHADKKMLEQIFRSMHTIKSNCGFANLAGLEAVAHDAESILMHMRDGDEPTEQNIDYIFNAAALIRTIVQALEYDQSPGKRDMRPLSDAWKVLPAAVSDLEKRLDKKISLQTSGGEFQVNAALIPVIKNILIHLARNTADHGIGKTGALMVTAQHDDRWITLEVSDNGKGLSVPAIKKQIIARKLATESELQGMLQADIFDFIFRPGFSTAEQVNVFSGRGVGLDSVKDAVTQAGGSVTIESAPDAGCRFIIKVPENPPPGLAVPASGATIP